MPHKCTKCGKIYPDGDPKILKGCECGNTRFVYVPKKKRETKKEEFSGVETVKIISPGMYEINLEKIFSRDEIVIAIQEEGRYAIHLPSLIGKIGKRDKKLRDKKKSTKKD